MYTSLHKQIWLLQKASMKIVKLSVNKTLDIRRHRVIEDFHIPVYVPTYFSIASKIENKARLFI